MGVKLAAASGGSIELVPTNTASNFTLTVPAGTGTAAVQGVSTNIVAGTAVASTSGTSIDFTGIPSWIKRITVMFSGVSASGTSPFLIRLGTSGGIVSSGYNSTGSGFAVGVTSSASSTVGFITRNGRTAGSVDFGVCQISNLTGNTWVINGGFASSATTENSTFSGGISNLGGTLDRIRITSVNGTDTFSAGSINILYE
jgi:hypothetical protein